MKKINYGRRIRSVFADDTHRFRATDKIIGMQAQGTLLVAVNPHGGPKPKRYPVLCHGIANDDCVRCRVPAEVRIIKEDL